MGKNYRNSDFHQEFRCPQGKFLVHPVPGDAPFGKKPHNPSFSQNPKHSQNGETIGDGFGFENGIHSPDGRPKKRMPEDKTVHHSNNRIGRRGINKERVQAPRWLVIRRKEGRAILLLPVRRND
jgi:hypothetical protein